MTQPIELDVVSDTVCPWCFIGKRRLDQALARRSGGAPVQVRWRPYQLDPSIPPEGVERKAYLSAKFGDEERLKAVGGQIRDLGEDAGIHFAFERIATTPNTLDSHRLIRWAKSAGIQHEMVERLFSLYFEEAADIGDRAVLVEAARDLGMDADLVARLLDEGADAQSTAREAAMASQMGIQGVPAFVFNGQFALVGAQEPETLLKALARAETDGPR